MIRLEKISVGLRHRRSFRIPEIAGSITDTLGHDEKSPFGKDSFKKTDSLIDRGEVKGRVIATKDGETSVVVDIDSVIVNYACDDVDKGITQIRDNLLPYLINTIHKPFNINYFNRLGVLYEFSLTEVPNFLVSQMTQGTFERINGSFLKFSYKESDSMSKVMKDLLDYKNYIVEIGVDDEKALARFDYQFYFNPEIKKTGDIDFESFFAESKEKLNAKFLNWINDAKQK
jgi:hypothetical protein